MKKRILPDVTAVTARSELLPADYQNPRGLLGLNWRLPMYSPRNSSIVAERIIHAALDLIDEQQEKLLAIVESERSTTEEKYDALVNLAHMTGVLTAVQYFGTPLMGREQ